MGPQHLLGVVRLGPRCRALGNEAPSPEVRGNGRDDGDTGLMWTNPHRRAVVPDHGTVPQSSFVVHMRAQVGSSQVKLHVS